MASSFPELASNIVSEIFRLKKLKAKNIRTYLAGSGKTLSPERFETVRRQMN